MKGLFWLTVPGTIHGSIRSMELGEAEAEVEAAGHVIPIIRRREK